MGPLEARRSSEACAMEILALLIGPGRGGAPVSAVGAASSLDLKVFATLVILAAGLFILAAGVQIARRRRRERLMRDLRAHQRIVETAGQGLFTGRRAHEPVSVAPDVGKPRTVVSAGRIVYTKTGDVLTFGSTMEGQDDGVVTAAVAREAVPPPPPPSAAPAPRPVQGGPSYAIERVVAMHDSGVAMLAVDDGGRVVRGDALDSELLVTLEELLEEARWSSTGTASGVRGERSVTVCRGGELHLAAVVDGDGDERLDRELRWALGELRSSPAWSLARPRTGAERQAGWLALRGVMSRVLEITRGADPARGGASSERADLRLSTTVAMRGGLAEYIVGIVNKGPGAVYDVQLLPSFGQAGVMEAVTVTGAEVDAKGAFIVREVPESGRASATFLLRPLTNAALRLECTVVYLRGVAAIQEVRLPGRWLEVEGVTLAPGEEVEPARALELAVDPSAFQDREALLVPPDVDGARLMRDCVDELRQGMRPVSSLEDADGGRLESWLHAELPGGATLVACLTMMAPEGMVEAFVSSTLGAAVPGAMLHLRQALNRVAGRPLVDALDPETRSSVSRSGFLLEGSWGELPGP